MAQEAARIRTAYPTMAACCRSTTVTGQAASHPTQPIAVGPRAAAPELGTAISPSAGVGATNARQQCAVHFRHALPVSQIVPRFGCSALSVRPVAPFGATAATRLPLGYSTDTHHARYARTSHTRCAARSAQLQALRLECREGGLVRPIAWRCSNSLLPAGGHDWLPN